MKYAHVMGVLAVGGLASTASATVYGDSDDDIFDLGFQHLDISSVEVTNDATHLHICVQTDGDLDAVAWGKYIVMLDTKPGGDPSNGWGRNIAATVDHDYYIGTWADDGGSGFGGELREWDGAAWPLIDATYGAGTEISGDDSQHASGKQIISVTLASMGLNVGDSILFDVATTGGGTTDPGVDHLSNSAMATPGWGDASTPGQYLKYVVIPAPSSAALLGLGGLALARRRR